MRDDTSELQNECGFLQAERDALAARVATLEAAYERLVRLAARMASWLWATGAARSEAEVIAKTAKFLEACHPESVAAVRAWLAQPSGEKGGEG